MSEDKRALSPEQKAAAVVVSLGVDKASQIYKHLSEEDLEKLTVEVAKLQHLTPEQIEEVLDEFYKMCLTQKVVTDGGLEYAKTVLEKAFGESVAHGLLERVSKQLKTRAFSFIRKTDGPNLVTILSQERPQTIALVLAYVDSTLSSQVIENLNDEKRLQVVHSIATMSSVAPDIIKIVEKELEKKFANMLTTDYKQVGGIDYIAEVMNNMDRSSEKSIFDGLSERDAELAEEIRKRMFVFEDITTMDNRSIQRFVRDCDSKDLVFALKGANEEVKSMIFANMSSRMAESIKSDLEITTNVRKKDVEDAQQRIVGIIRKLEEQGEIIIMKGGRDDIIA